VPAVRGVLAAGFALLLGTVVDTTVDTTEGAAAPPSSAFMIKELPG
jgi:hypothetical protein